MSPILIRFMLGRHGHPVTISARTIRAACIQAEEMMRDLAAEDVTFSTFVLHRNRSVVSLVDAYLSDVKAEIVEDKAQQQAAR